MLKKLFLNKKGASKMIEALIILPIAVFITLLSFYKLQGMIVTNQMDKFNRELTRTVITASDFDSGMEALYTKIIEQEDYKVSYVKIYYRPTSAIIVDGKLEEAQLTSISLNFSTNNNSQSSFNNYFKVGSKGYELQSKMLQEQNYETYSALSQNWKMSNFLEIGLSNDLTKNIYSKISKISVIVNGERREFPLALTSVITTSNIQVISSEV